MTRQRPTLRNKSCSDSCQQSCHANNWRNCMIGRLGLQLGEAHESSHKPQKTTKLQTSQTNNTSAGQSILHKQHKSRRQHNKIWQRDSGACSSTFTLTDKETTSHSVQRRTLKRNRASRFLLDILSVRTELCDKSKAETRHVSSFVWEERRSRKSLPRDEELAQASRACQLTKQTIATNNLHLYKAHKSVVSSQHQSYKAQQENLKPGEVLVVLDFKENLQVGSGPIEVGNDCFSKTQVSCLGFAVHIGGNTTTHYFDCISFSLMMDCLWESLDQVIPEIQTISSVKVKQWVFVNLFLLVLNFWLFFAFLNFWLCFLLQFLTDGFFVINFWLLFFWSFWLFFFADFPFGWIVDLTFVVTKWWTTFFVKEHRSTKLKQLESIFLLNIMANQQWTHTFLTFLVLWVNGLWPSTLQTLMTSKRRLLRTLSSPKLQWQ